MRAAARDERRPSCSTSSPIRLSIRRGAGRAGSPSGRPQIARTCCSNCEVSGALDRPVAAVVHARRDLVDHRRRRAGEELDRQHPDMVERLGDARRRVASAHLRAIGGAGARVGARRMPPRARSAASDRADLAVGPRASDDREFGVEIASQLSTTAGRAPIAVPRRLGLVARADPDLALAVVAERRALRIAGAPISASAARARRVVDRRPRRVRSPAVEEVLLVGRSWAIASAARRRAAPAPSASSGRRRDARSRR